VTGRDMSRKKASLGDEIETPGGATRATTLYRAIKEDIIRGSFSPREWLRIDGKLPAGAYVLDAQSGAINARDLVLAADSVFLLAQKRAFAVATYLAYGLAQLEFRAFLLDSVGGMLRQQAGMTRRGSVLIAASFRSYTREVVEAAELAHTQGAAVIAITDQAVSPLAKFARVTLLVGDDPTVQFRSLVAPLCAAQALVMALGYAIAERNAKKAPPGAKKRAAGS